MCEIWKEKGFHYIVKFFLCCVFRYSICGINLQNDIWIVLHKRFDILISNRKVHSLPVIVLEVFFILFMPAWMLSLFVFVVKHSTNRILEAIRICIIDTNTAVHRFLDTFRWWEVKPSSSVLLYSCWCFRSFIVSISISWMGIFGI